MLIKRWKAYFFVTFPLTFTHNSRHGAKTETDVLPLDKTTQGLIVLFPFDTAEGSIMGLLQATCIMPNSLRPLFSSLVIQSSQQPTGGIKKKKSPQFGSPMCAPPLPSTDDPFASSGRRWGSGDEEPRRGGERTHVTQSERGVLRLSL